MSAQESEVIARSDVSTRPAILIVEDELILAKDLQCTLIDLGYDAFAIASSAEAAVRRAAERCPDLVIMDIRIKGPHDGIQTASILKKKFSTAVIYLTAHADKAMIDRAKETEPHGYLLKPVSVVEIRTTVEIALYKHQLEQARAEKAELQRRQQLVDEQFRLALEAAPTGMLMMDEAGTIALVNAQIETLFGYGRDELLGKRLEMLVPERFRAHHPALRKTFFGDPKTRVMGAGRELYGLRKDGTEVPVEIGLNPLQTPEGSFVLSSIADITERKLAYEAQQRMTAELRDNNRQLERSNRDLEDFAYIASHDLKTPLSGIKSAALWLEEDLHDLSDESRKLLGLMRSRINRMEKLLDDLLTFSRIGRTDAAVGETTLADIFASIIEVLNPPAHIQVRVEGDLPVSVTAGAQLEQVLRNLIDNAIKHHDKQKGEVVLSAKRAGDRLEFVIRDDGPGILPQFHETIFQLFQTLKRRDEVESTGMGLTIVKKLVERQNCRVTVHSEGDGTGAQFRFQWPLLRPTCEDKETAHD
jgi:PAS domain S-box-containing protein